MIVRGVVASQNPTVSFYTEGNMQFPIRRDAKGQRLASLIGREVELSGDFKREGGQPVFCVSHYEVIDDVDDWIFEDLLKEEKADDELDFHEAPARYHWY